MSLDAYYALCDLYYHYLHESLLQSLALGVTAFPLLCRSSPLCHWTPIMLYVICIIIISMSFIAVTRPRSDCSFMSLDAYYALCDLYYHYLHESLLQSLTLGVTAFPFL